VRTVSSAGQDSCSSGQGLLALRARLGTGDGSGWARLRARVSEQRGEHLLLKELAVRLALLDPADSTSATAPDLASHWLPGSLPSRLNVEWRSLCAAPDTAAVVAGWASDRAALAGLASLRGLLRRIADEDPVGRDAVLLALLELARGGDELAGRVVLQVMLPKAVRVAMSVVRRPDVLGDREEAQARAVAALWQAIATYPLLTRPARVPGNLALDTLALVQRGHTGSSHFTVAFPEQSFADLQVLGEAGRLDVGPDDLFGPADAELLMLLAWSVRSGVLELQEARLLARIYLPDGQPPDTGVIAAELGISRAALRQRCSRLARRLGDAAIAAGVSPVDRTPGAAFVVAA
jgi:hypothetical protein